VLKHRMDDKAGVFEIEVDGSIDADSYRAVVRDMEAGIKAHGQIAVLETITSIGWISPEITTARRCTWWSASHVPGRTC